MRVDRLSRREFQMMVDAVIILAGGAAEICVESARPEFGRKHDEPDIFTLADLPGAITLLACPRSDPKDTRPRGQRAARGSLRRD